VARLSDGNQRAQPVVEWTPASSGVETGCHMDWADYLRDEAAKYRQLAKAAEDLAIKQELLDLAAVCEEAADNIEDRMPSGQPDHARSATWPGPSAGARSASI